MRSTVKKSLIVVALWLAVLLLMCLCGCRSVKYVPVETVRTDSTVIHDTLMDVRLVPYRDSVAVRDTSSYLSNPYAWSWAVWSDGVLHHSLVVWPGGSIRVKVPYFIDRIVRIREPQLVEVERELTRWQRFRMGMGDAMLCLLAFAVLGLAGYWLKKRIFGA